MTPADPYPVLRTLLAHLEGRLRGGEKRLWLTAGAAQSLREIVRMKPRLRPSAEPVHEEPVKAPPPAVQGTRRADSAAVLPMEESPPPTPQRLVLPEFISLPAAALQEPLPLEEREKRLAAVRDRAQEGATARALGTLRDRMVFAVGSPVAEIVLVGEAPGAEEERQGEPFVGPAGQLLTKILKAMGLDRPQVYITNICKYRPAMENQGRGNRPPTPEEMASCLEFVREEIAIIRPRVIVALGGTAITGLLGIRTGVMNARGKFYMFEGIPVMATLHPSYLLRKEQEGPEAAKTEKAKLWQDLLLVMEKAGMPISDKQRGFFPSK